MPATWSPNPEKQGVEIRFDEKPPEPVREALKAARWRWSRASRCWYAKDTPVARQFAEKLVGGAPITLAPTVAYVHPVYAALKHLQETTPDKWRARYLDVKQLAELVRSALRRSFATTAFSVRIERYSMGSAVRVSWRGGPSRSDVEAVVRSYDCTRFDAMTDYGYSLEAYLTPDGRIIGHHSAGRTNGTDAAIEDPKPQEECIPVSAHSHVSCSRMEA